MTQSETQPDAALDQGERVETLLIEFSARFISLAPEHVDREIQDAQRRICDYRRFDRSSLFEQPAEDPAALLGVKPTTFESRMAKLGIHRRAEDSTK
jgi:hypothetical protein